MTMHTPTADWDVRVALDPELPARYAAYCHYTAARTRTLRNLARLWHREADSLVVPVPPDGSCLAYCLIAAGQRSEWMQDRQPNGFNDGPREALDAAEARLMRDTVIALAEQQGDFDEASRLRQAGSAGYPTDHTFQYYQLIFGGEY